MQTETELKITRRRPYAAYLRFIPAMLWMVVIYGLSSRTQDELDVFLPWFQKLFPMMESFNWGHFAAYFILGLTFDFGFGRSAVKWRVKLLIILLCILYGVTDEYHQSFVGGRTPDWHDLRNDGIGAALAVLFTALPWIQKLRKKLRL